MKKFLSLVIASTILFINGCASILEATGFYSLNEAQCLSGNWYQIGFEDGVNDESVQRVDKHSSSCARFNVQVNYQLYQKGFDEGFKVFVQDYCRPANAFQLGSSGEGYRSICPDALRREFLAAYDAGYHEYIDGYCTESNGYALGRRGQARKDICPRERVGEFKLGYDRGRRIYRKERNLINEIDDLTDEIDEIEDDIEDLEDIIATECKGNGPCPQRARVERLQRDVDDLRSDRKVAREVLREVQLF